MDLTRANIFHPPVKRSITIAGHQTSITLEPLFWGLLKAATEKRGLPLNALVAQIDVERVGAEQPPGLATAIRLWLTDDLIQQKGQSSGAEYAALGNSRASD